MQRYRLSAVEMEMDGIKLDTHTHTCYPTGQRGRRRRRAEGESRRLVAGWGSKTGTTGGVRVGRWVAGW